jgi:hypothetical protein
MIYKLGICSVGTLKSNISFPFYHTIDDTGRCTVNSLTQGWYRLCHTIVRTVDYFLESFVYSFVLEYINFNLLLFLGLKTCFIYFWSFVSRTKVGFSKSILTQNFHQTTRLRWPYYYTLWLVYLTLDSKLCKKKYQRFVLGLKTCFIYFWSFVSRTNGGLFKVYLDFQNFHLTTRLQWPYYYTL